MSNAELLIENKALREIIRNYELKLEAIKDYIDYYEGEMYEEKYKKKKTY